MERRRGVVVFLLLSVLACGPAPAADESADAPIADEGADAPAADEGADAPIADEGADADCLGHVEVFGYYHSWQYLAETLPYSNMVWGPPPTAAAASAAGIRAMVDVQGVFQIASATSRPAEIIESEWRKVAEQLTPHLPAVVALYPSDEPYWNASRNGVSFEETRRRLEAAARLIHATPGFEQVPVATIFADPELDWMADGEAWNPAGFTWVGFDRYVASPGVLAERTSLFLSLIRPDQRIIAVPDAMLPASRTDDLLGLEQRIDFWMAWIEQTPSVVAVAPFIYWSGGDATLTWIGARDMPLVRERYLEFGNRVVAQGAGFR